MSLTHCFPLWHCSIVGLLCRTQLTTGWITQEEFVSAGANSLPVFPEHAHLGHHYDEESE